MPDEWQLEDAKNRLAEVVEEAIQGGPQVIMRDGEQTAIIMSYAQYRRLILGQPKLSEFFRGSPLVGMDLELNRDRSHVREDLPL